MDKQVLRSFTRLQIRSPVALRAHRIDVECAPLRVTRLKAIQDVKVLGSSLGKVNSFA